MHVGTSHNLIRRHICTSSIAQPVNDRPSLKAEAVVFEELPILYIAEKKKGQKGIPKMTRMKTPQPNPQTLARLKESRDPSERRMNTRLVPEH